MLNSSRIDPDIEVKYHQIVAHMNEKNKVIEQFTRILKQFCDWEMFNSRNLDKFANSISKLLVGKDPLKDTFILFQRILATKAEQSNKIAVNIKEDMLPFLQQAYNIKQQTAIKSQQQSVREVKQLMQLKLRQLYSAQTNYKSAAQKHTTAHSRAGSHSRQQLQQLTLSKRSLLDSQSYLTEVINSYNLSIQHYMLQYSNLCEQLSSIESNRKTVIKEAISKYIVFEMDAVKNIQYDLSRYAKSIQQMDDRLVIVEKGNGETDGLRVQLAKVSVANYIANLVGKKVGTCQTDSQRRLAEIKKFLDPLSETYELKKDTYFNLVNDISELLSEAEEVFDIKMVKEVVYYASNFYMLSSLPEKVCDETQRLTFRRAKVPLLNAILCHAIFVDETFWQRYSSRLGEMVEKEVTTMVTGYQRKSDETRVSASLLSGDVQFMKKISSLPIVTRILAKYSRYTNGSSEHMVKSNDTIGSKMTEKDKARQKAQQSQDEFKATIDDLVFF